MATQPVLDFREGEHFFKTGAEIREAIRSKIHDELKAELKLFMAEVSGELEGVTPDEAASLFLAIMLDEHLSPKALLVRRCLDKAVECQREISALTFIYNNITYEKPSVTSPLLYKLTLSQVIRYGLAPKTGDTV